MQRAFAIIKPDAVKAGHTGAIISRIEKAGFRIASDAPETAAFELGYFFRGMDLT